MFVVRGPLVALYEVGVWVMQRQIVRVIYSTGCFIYGCATKASSMLKQITDKNVGRGRWLGNGEA